MKSKVVIGSIIILVAMAWGISSFFGSTVQYVSIAEARTADRTVQVMGKIDTEQVKYNSSESRLEFAIYDAEATDKAQAVNMKIVYYGTVPGNFDQATSVVCKGVNKEEGFVAEKLLVKCPSKYQGEVSEDYQDITKHKGGVMGDTNTAATPDSI
ncbi:MAG TPA: cytochrome c maturation protein CcmE [candidate division Zixibacteria bacterium]|nr:cytochrome c maturation protein CcmE [candidate division Zixibacteria bacterium]